MLISRVLRRFSKRYESKLKEEVPELASECLVEILLALEDESKTVTQKELCTQLELDKSRIAIMIRELSELNYLVIERNNDDRREHFVSLTKSGRDLIPKIKQAILHIDKRLGHDLSEIQLIQFYSIVYQMDKNLSKQS